MVAVVLNAEDVVQVVVTKVDDLGDFVFLVQAYGLGLPILIKYLKASVLRVKVEDPPDIPNIYTEGGEGGVGRLLHNLKFANINVVNLVLESRDYLALDVRKE